MKLQEYLFLLAVWAVFAFAGCSRQQERVLAAEPVCFERITAEQAVKSAEDALVSIGFSIEKSDPNSGMVRTAMLRGGQFFEPWRKDNAGLNEALMSNLHSIRRQAEITVTQVNNRVLVKCNVVVYRLSIPERKFEGMTGSPGLFTKSRDSLQSLRLNTEQAERVAWIDLGPDPKLEVRILERIAQKLSSQAGQRVR